MSSSATSGSLHDYLRVLRRRAWVVALAVVLVPGAAVGYSITQKHLYSASAQVALSHTDLAGAVSGVAGQQAPSGQADRDAQTQANIAQSPQVAAAVVKHLHLTGMTAGELLGSSSVSAKTNADVLVFSVTNGVAALAQRLATAYASEYIAYRKALDTAAVVRARRGLRQQISRLESTGNTQSALYASLIEKDQQLSVLQALLTSNASLFHAADSATKVQPKPTRNGIIGLALGIVLGLGLAFLIEALDTRVRGAEEVAESLGVDLLARIPTPSRALSSADRLVMVEDPGGNAAEPFRVLRTSLEFTNLDHGARTIAVTSALAADGKSTTVANLAVALALAGKKVILVDLDFRRPYLDRFFPLAGKPGLTDVILGHARLADALVRCSLTSPSLPGLRRNGNSSNGAPKVTGSLDVIGTGPIPPNPGELIGSRGLTEILAELARNTDVVLIDSPPLIGVGDTLTLSRFVDAFVIVARSNALRRGTLAELHRILDASPARVLGFVLTAADRKGGYGYGSSYTYGYGYGHADQPADKAAATTPAREPA